LQNTEPHMPEETLVQYLAGHQSKAVRDAVEEHLLMCDVCRVALECLEVAARAARVLRNRVVVFPGTVGRTR